MAASAPLLAPAAMARVSRPRPHRRVRSHRAGPSRIRATEPNQVPDVGATPREMERLDMELEAHRDAPDEDTPAIAKKTKPPADPVRWPLVHARAVEALAHILANPGTDAQKVMRKALRAQYRPRKTLVYDGSSSERWPGAEPPTNTERGAIADAVLAPLQLLPLCLAHVIVSFSSLLGLLFLLLVLGLLLLLAVGILRISKPK